MNKLFFTTLSLLIFSTNSFSEQMKEKKVCNTLENGAEFCTVFKVPVDNKQRKTEEEINQDLAKKSELVFNKKTDKKPIVENNKPSKSDRDIVEVQDEASINQERNMAIAKKNVELKKQEEKELAKKKEKELALAKEKEEEEAREKKIALEKEKKREARLEEIRLKKKEKELAKKKQEEEVKEKKKKELALEKEKSKIVEEKKEEAPQAIKVEQAPTKAKPTFKDKENFSNFLSTVKSLE